MKIKLVFDDWRNKDHQSIYNTEEGVDLSTGDLHSGSSFKAEITLDEECSEDMKRALEAGYVPVFWVVKDD